MTTINTVADALDAVAHLIGEPSRWTVDAEARNASGGPVAPTSPRAAAWSIGGAVERVIDPEATDITDAEWRRRTDLESATYRALGITTDRADGGLSDHRVTVLVVRDARARIAV